MQRSVNWYDYFKANRRGHSLVCNTTPTGIIASRRTEEDTYLLTGVQHHSNRYNRFKANRRGHLHSYWCATPLQPLCYFKANRRGHLLTYWCATPLQPLCYFKANRRGHLLTYWCATPLQPFMITSRRTEEDTYLLTGVQHHSNRYDYFKANRRGHLLTYWCVTLR